jgi:predicted ATP-grasp superfamily ATP-dependent carboligase
MIDPKIKVFQCLTGDEIKRAKANDVRDVYVQDMTLEELDDLCSIIAEEGITEIISNVTKFLTQRYHDNKNKI